MPAPAIKICGINSPKALDAVLEQRADYAGLVFFPLAAPSRLARCGDAGERAAGRTKLVGLFVDADDAMIGEALAAARLDVVQLHGKESPERVAQVKARFGLPVWKALSIASAADVAAAARYDGAADLLLFDAKAPKGAALPGGLGLVFDWSLLAARRGPTPWGLAGGLSPANVGEAVRATGTGLVDVSSGVESAPGVKDESLIRAFCRAARDA
jgi:phosphoribosylanthranilate isomerase